MELHFELDMREFNRAIEEYLDATKKDLAYVCNRQAVNVAIKAKQNTPLADPDAIEAVGRRAWWPKYISKRLGKTSKAGKRKAKGRTGFTRAMARRASRSYLASRKRRRGFIAAGWKRAIAILAAHKEALKTGLPLIAEGRAGRIYDPPGDAIPAIPGEVVFAEIINRAKAARPVAGIALQQGIYDAGEDMLTYIREQMQPTADLYNAK